MADQSPARTAASLFGRRDMFHSFGAAAAGFALANHAVAAARYWSTRCPRSTWRSGTSPASSGTRRSTGSSVGRPATGSASTTRRWPTRCPPAARARVGPKGAVMFDVHSALPPATLIQVAAAIKPYDVMFIEEPGVPGNIEIFKRLRDKIDEPLATGERDRTIYEVIPYLQERCIDILQPDCSHTGGISQMRKIATLAEAYYVPLAPHCTGSFLGIAASLHVAASIPLFLIHEFYPDNVGKQMTSVTSMEYAYDAEGYIGLPPGPGLGVEVDEKLLVEEASKPQTYKWPGQKLKDGSVADY